MIEAITIETQPTESGPTWYTIAAWFGGTILTGLLILLAWSVWQFAKGKLHANPESTKKGLMGAGLSVGGAIVMGTAAGAIAWSAQSSTYNIAGAGDGDGSGSQGLANLMPAGARPSEVEVFRESPLVSCEGPVSVEAANHERTVRSSWPTASEHQGGENMLENNGVLEAVKSQAYGDGYLEAGGFSFEFEDQDAFDSRWDDEFRVSSLEWVPADSNDGCGTGNREAASGTTITVTLHWGSGEYAFHDRAWPVVEVTVP